MPNSSNYRGNKRNKGNKGYKIEQRTEASIDIGSDCLKGVVARKGEDNVIEIIAYSQIPSSGFEGGELKDAVSFRASLGELSNALAAQIDDDVQANFVLSINEKSAFLTDEVKAIALTEDDEREYVTNDHVQDLLLRFFASGRKETEETETSGGGFDFLNNSRSTLHAMPKKYILDETKYVVNPVDMEASILAVEASVLSIDSTAKESVINMFTSQIGGPKPNLHLSPFVSSIAVLNSKEMDAGVISIDMGHSFTTVTAFRSNSIIYFKQIDQSLKNVMKDVAKVFNTSVSEAERMVKNYGKVAFKDTSTDTISYVMLDGKSTKQIARSQLSLVIYAKIKEIMNYVKKEIRVILTKMAEDGDASIPGGIVVTGGGARIDGIIEFIRDTFNLSVRIGNVEDNDKFVIEAASDMDSCIYSAAIGNLFIVSPELDEDYYYEEDYYEEKTRRPIINRTKKKKEKEKDREKEGPSVMDKVANFLKKLV
ncbi:MAG TPA: cell division FtsA domain-containing protein [Thermotogota bacterium]|nr:cell division FtsA domain-containing protein [Thermotogota bacterium]HPJ89266.1 cell division FtsA domain-containing protein [Thermotogota bacterium]HPR96442.1 cell division FtsA domain-containing protein [Thermotogota bacterium]